MLNIIRTIQEKKLNTYDFKKRIHVILKYHYSILNQSGLQTAHYSLRKQVHITNI